jgi:hypothetical protein
MAIDTLLVRETLVCRYCERAVPRNKVCFDFRALRVRADCTISPVPSDTDSFLVFAHWLAPIKVEFGSDRAPLRVGGRWARFCCFLSNKSRSRPSAFFRRFCRDFSIWAIRSAFPRPLLRESWTYEK